jgi:hypothetical protein
LRAFRANLRRFLLRLIVAGWACCLTSQIGLVQSPLIVNRTPSVLGPPQEIEPPRPTVLEFESQPPPANGPTIGYVTLESDTPPQPQILLFDARPSPVTLVWPDRSVLPPSRFGDELPRELPLPVLSTTVPEAIGTPRETVAPVVIATQASMAVPEPIVVPRETVEPAVMATQPSMAVTVGFARPAAVLSERPLFGRVIGVGNFAQPVWPSEPVRFLAPRQLTFQEQVTGVDRSSPGQDGPSGERDR